MMARVAMLKVTNLMFAAIVVGAGGLMAATAQTPSRAAADQPAVQIGPQMAGNPAATDDPYFRAIYRSFYEGYRLGPADEIAIRVMGQPDYSVEKAQVSPFGRIYHPLLGEIDVAGSTVSQLTNRLTAALSEFIIGPRVSVSLLAANSAKVGVLGDVTHPGILLMAKPMTMLDAISASGGVTDLGKKSNVTLLRQLGEGRMQTMTVNVKHILEGKPDAGEENIALQAGDTIIVHGNFKKTLATITQLTGFGYFIHTISGH
jgi:polysaccharide export outer membrane protein